MRGLAEYIIKRAKNWENRDRHYLFFIMGLPTTKMWSVPVFAVVSKERIYINFLDLLGFDAIIPDNLYGFQQGAA